MTGPGRGETRWLVAGGAVLIAGVFADGWAHTHALDELESFITPWHTIIFVGYLITLGTVFRAIRIRLPGMGTIRASVPPGWEAPAVGTILFAAGFAGDGIWHTIFGIEAQLDALVSPTHLLMLAGGVSILVGPIAAAWRENGSRRTSWDTHGAVVAAAVLVTLAVAFFMLWAWPPGNPYTTRWFALENSGFVEAMGEAMGLANYLLFTLVLVGPPLLILKRWDPPRGTVFLLVTTPSLLLLVAVLEFSVWQRFVPFVIAGLVGEWIAHRHRPGPANPWAGRALGAALPLVTYSTDMAAVAIVWGLGWPAEFVAGSVVFASLLGLALGFLAFSPVGAHEAVPAADVDDAVPDRRGGLDAPTGGRELP